MAPRSKVYVGRYDETLEEVRDVVKGTTKGTEPHRLNRLALAFLEQIGDVAKPDDTVHVSANCSDDGQDGRTYTVTMSRTPAPPPKPVKPTPTPTDAATK